MFGLLMFALHYTRFIGVRLLVCVTFGACFAPVQLASALGIKDVRVGREALHLLSILRILPMG